MISPERLHKELEAQGEPYYADVVPVSKLGNGGFSQVFLAEKGDSKIAVKRWDPYLIEDARGFEVGSGCIFVVVSA
jgi:hypothetical protein